jgi:hypothetical protein
MLAKMAAKNPNKYHNQPSNQSNQSNRGFKGFKGFQGFQGIGHPSIILEGLSENQCDEVVKITARNFSAKYPHLEGIITNFEKQKVILGLEYWYRKPLQDKHKKYCKIEVQSLLEGVSLTSDEGIMLVQLCQQLMEEYDL